MSQAKQQIKESGKPQLNRIEITMKDGPTLDRLCKQIEELNKRVARLEDTVKKLEAKNEITKDRSTHSTQPSNISTGGRSVNNQSFNRQKSLNVKLVDINSAEKDKTPKSVQTNKDAKLSTVSSPSSKSPPLATNVSAAQTQYQKPQVMLTRTSSQIEPFISRKNFASVAQMSQMSSVQNGTGVVNTSSNGVSPVKNFTKQYEELTRSRSNLDRRKSQSATDVITLQFDKRKSTPESKKLQLSLAPQSKDSLSTSLNGPSVVQIEVKSNINSPTSPPDPTPPKPVPTSGPPAAPPLPKSDISEKSQRRNSVIDGPSAESSIKSQSRIKELAKADSSYDALMDQLKQFADSGFPFKRQITKQTKMKSNNLNLKTK